MSNDLVARAVRQAQASVRELIPDSVGRIHVLRIVTALLEILEQGGDDSSIGKAINELFDTVGRLDATAREQVNTAQAATAAMASQLAKARQHPQPLATPVSADVITTEISRRQSLRGEIAEAQESVENEREALREMLQGLQFIFSGEALETEQAAHETRLEILEAQVAAYKADIRHHDESVSRLKTFRTALILVSKGLPADLLPETHEVAEKRRIIK